MLLLVTDTSGKNGSVALARAADGPKPDGVQVIEAVQLAGGTFSALLVPQIAALLAKHGFRKTDLDALVVVSGPGSFTGLRVGLAAIKGLAEILNKAIVPVSLLEAIALASGLQGRVLAALDAGRGDIYAGKYEVTGDTAKVLGESVLSPEEFLSAAREWAPATPVENLATLARSNGLQAIHLESLGMDIIARLGWQKLRAGKTITPEQLEANYVRRSDAEIFAKTNS
jgi:tRNA threonylcarbamoyladenosine biosynthesis protein TsaB